MWVRCYGRMRPCQGGHTLCYNSSMSREVDVAWAAGLFEGEGSILSKSKYSFSLAITSTDLDVLKRLQGVAGGGTITMIAKRKEHWKQAWLWQLYGPGAIDFLKEMKPHLMSRRSKKADEMLARLETKAVTTEETMATRKKILELWETGQYTETQIGVLTGTNRSYVNALRRGKMKV